MSGYTLAKPHAITCEKITRLWSEVNINNTRCIDIFAKYRYIEVAIVDLFGDQSCLNLYDYEFELRMSYSTVPEWLAGLGNRKLILTEGYPTLSIKEAFYVPGMRYNGDFRLSKANTHPSHDVPVDDCTDLVVKYDNVDMHKLSNTTLWSVNGYYLPSHYNNGYVRVPNAGAVIKKSKNFQFGCLNFKHIGNVSTIPITEEMVFKVDPLLDDNSRIHINVGKVIATHTVGIVIGGYLHLLDNFLTVTSHNTIAVTLGKLSVINRILESKDTLDLSFMCLENIEEGALVKDVIDPKLLITYLTCQYSCIVLIENTNLYKNDIPVDNNAAIGCAITPDDIYPARLITNTGKSVDYWYTEEAGKRCLQFNDIDTNHYIFHKTNWQENPVINNARIGAKITTRIFPHITQYLAKV